MMGYEGGMFHGAGLMWIFWLVLIAVIVIVFVSSSVVSGQPKKERALELLKLRYAKGEIDESEYEKGKATLAE